VSLTCLYLSSVYRDKQLLKARSPIWLGISLIVGQIQTGNNLWSLVDKTECHYFQVVNFISYNGYMMCLIVRCWKLHFIFNVNNSKLLKTDYKCWFQRKKFYVSERFLIPIFVGLCIILCLLGFIFNATNKANVWHPAFGHCNAPWIPDMGTNTLIFFVSVVILIAFSFLLHNVRDGFNISRELRLSIGLIVGSWGIFFYSFVFWWSCFQAYPLDNKVREKIV